MVEPLYERLKNPATRREAFTEVVRKYSPQLYRQIRRLVTWHEDADDVLQDTFLKAWSGLDNYKGEAQISSWLYRIALNESLAFLARQKAAVSIDGSEAERTLESDPWFDGDELQAKLQKAVSLLPEKQRIVFNMKYFDEMKYEEMSQILQTSVGALKASYFFAVRKIEEYFAANP